MKRKCERNGCENQFYRGPNVKSKQFFCSRTCKELTQSGENSPVWKGGRQAWYPKRLRQDSERKRLYKQKAVNFMGGKCQDCNYDRCVDALDFHHIDPATKHKDLKTLTAGKWEKVLEELKKCVLICANCHRERHWRQRHG